jgi:hypothetical protein
VSGPLNLVFVDIETSDMASCKLDNLPRRTTDATADVENLHSAFNANLAGEEVFMTSNCSIKGFTICKAAEVE